MTVKFSGDVTKSLLIAIFEYLDNAKNFLYTDKWHVIYWSEAVICVQTYVKTTCKHNEHILGICNTDYLSVIQVINWIKSSVTEKGPCLDL